MSFKIFSLQLTGKIKPVEKIEQHREQLQKDYQEFLKVEKSDELKEIQELNDFVNSSEFKNKKDEIVALQFKGSKEYDELREFEKLKKAKHLKNYFKVSGSADLKRYEKLTDSEKLKEFYELWDFVKEGQFQKEKKEIKSLVFKGSVEEQLEKEFQSLAKLPGIKAYFNLFDSAALKKYEKFSSSEKLKKYEDLKNIPELDKKSEAELNRLKDDEKIKEYFKFENSKEFEQYNETLNSHDLKRYQELKSQTGKEQFKKQVAFLKDKKRFEKSKTFKKFKKYKSLLSDSDIKFFLKFEKSSLYKNYLDVKESNDLNRFTELKEITTSKEFLDRKAYLEDKNKWEKTKEFDKFKKYEEFKKQPHIVKYFKYNNSAAFDFYKNWEVVFEDDFKATVLNSEKWSTVGVMAEKLLGDNYSLPGDLHIFTKGKNVKTTGKLSIEVKKEKSAGKMWKMPAGFIPAEFDYTSGMVSTAKSFWNEDGIYEAKIKFNPVKEIVSTFSLLGEKNTPAVQLLEMGTKNRLGISTLNGNGKVEVEGLDISNLKSGKSYIFTIEKTGSRLVWKINETEVFSIESRTVNFPLHLNASSIVVYDVAGHNLPAKFEIYWVKCYRKR